MLRKTFSIQRLRPCSRSSHELDPCHRPSRMLLCTNTESSTRRVIEEQRKSQKHGVLFEGQLRKKWKEGGGRKRQRDGGDVEDAPRAPNHCRLFLEMKGLL